MLNSIITERTIFFILALISEILIVRKILSILEKYYPLTKLQKKDIECVFLLIFGYVKFFVLLWDLWPKLVYIVVQILTA